VFVFFIIPRDKTKEKKKRHLPQAAKAEDDGSPRKRK
jgi:hypothetical protein